MTNQVVDIGLLMQTAEPARAILEVATIDVVADRGYFKIEDIAACEKAEMTPYVPKPQRGSSVSNGFFRKDEFRYDAGRDAYICPAGQTLKPFRHGPVARSQEDRLRQPQSLPRLPAARTMMLAAGQHRPRLPST